VTAVIRRRRIGDRALLPIALLLAGCPQRLDDDFRVRVSAAENPDAGPNVGGGITPGPTGDAGSVGPGPGPGPAPGPGPDSGPGTPPVILGSVPGDGAVGVLPDATVTLTFSAPMDRASVEAAYRSSDLPAGSVSFAWSDGDRVLRIQPNAVLRTNAGTDPASVGAVSYAVELAAGARDAAGNGLAPARIAFSTARAISQDIGAVTNRDLTGNWRSDSTYGLADCERIDTTVCMGDSPAAGEPAYRGFMTFDLRALPANLIAIDAAELSCTIALVYGTPFTNLGALNIDHVTFDSIGDAAFNAAPLPEHQSHTTPMIIGDVLAIDALAAVRADWTVRDYSQYRLAFSTATDGDASADQLGCDWSTLKLALSYWVP